MCVQITNVGRRGLEPRTYGLKVRSSTIELATPKASEALTCDLSTFESSRYGRSLGSDRINDRCD